MTAVPQVGSIDLPLAKLCTYVDEQQSLQCAQIMATECYSQSSGAVTHRFLLLELRREGRKDIWLRLDRRRGEGTSLLKFLSSVGITKANDRVSWL